MCSDLQDAVATRRTTTRASGSACQGRIPKHEAMAVMGITHDMTCEQIGEAVPPAYAAYVAALVMADYATPRW